MRVRMNRTHSIAVPDGGKRGGLPSRKVRTRQVLTVGGGYNLPDDIGRELVQQGLAIQLDGNQGGRRATKAEA